jgi:hypothetical protein
MFKRAKNPRTYQEAKKELFDFVKTLPFDDKPARRMAINDKVDEICKESFNRCTDAKQYQYKHWLDNWACLLHDNNLEL